MGGRIGTEYNALDGDDTVTADDGDNFAILGGGGDNFTVGDGDNIVIADGGTIDIVMGSLQRKRPLLVRFLISAMSSCWSTRLMGPVSF